MMISLHRPLGGWDRFIGDVLDGFATFDHVRYHANVIMITGRSHRVRDKDRQNKAAVRKGQVEGEGPATCRMQAEQGTCSQEDWLGFQTITKKMILIR